MEKKPLILISNDDGITAKGIANLVEVMKEIGEVVVVAPNKPQSGMGHAITIGQPIRLDKSTIFGEDILAFECSGTPADCVKLAKHHLFKDRTPDLVVSGINHGSNSSISVIYSGTMSAAIEAAIEGLPSIGFSLCDYGSQADFSHTHEFIRKIALQVLDKKLPKGVALNVNIPKKSDEKIKGIKVVRQALGHWGEEFDERTDPHHRKYFWLTGYFVNQDKGEDTDEWALKNNYVSVVPCLFDLTAHFALSGLNEWEL
ncbi:MAG: 5'/3'-nucleotidase SurE [Bacteroidetes bacterium]|nr:MAG: 5'/3'-nucleotidase SurE [Bacteroidota bacterium]TAG86887.1 MAG: 5'/3'-nucleotidase SurE [Bacteroidota bacterium]